MNFRIAFIINLLYCPLIFVDGHNILGIFIHTGESHFRFFQPVLNALVANGHTVTAVSYFPEQVKHENYTDLVLHGEILKNSINLTMFDDMNFIINRRSIFFYYLEMIDLFKWGRDACHNFLNSNVVDEIFKLHAKKPFDLVLTEIFNTDCHLSVIHKLNIPYIGMSSCVLMPWHYDRIGQPDTPSHIPTHMVGLSEQMNFQSRMLNWFVHRTMKSAYRIVEILDNRAIRNRFSDEIPDVHDLAKNASVVLVNQHYSFSGARPLSPAFIEVGGLHMKDGLKPLPKYFADLVNNARDGVVIISWGSMIRAATLPNRIRQSIVRAVAKFPQTFIWKWEEENMEDQPKNLITSKWLPQTDLLCHPNVRAFVSHGGLMGTTEAIYCGVPMIVTPIFGDQPNNAAALVNRNMAVFLEYEDITEETMTEAIRQVLRPENFKNAKTIAYSYNNRLMKPLDTALWWIDHSIKTKGHPLGKSHLMKMCWFSYYSFDVMLVFLVIIIVFVFISVKCIKYTCRLGPKKPGKQKKQ